MGEKVQFLEFETSFDFVPKRADQTNVYYAVIMHIGRSMLITSFSEINR